MENIQDFVQNHTNAGSPLIDLTEKLTSSRSFVEADAKANELERKANEARDNATAAFYAFVSEVEAKIVEFEADGTFDEEMADDAKEDLAEVVRGYGYENGLEVEYGFGSEPDMWEASTC